MIYKQHREIETSLSLGLCCSFSYSKISKRLEGVAYKLLLINHTACSQTIHYCYISIKLTYQYVICGYDGAARRPPGGACRPAGLRGLVAVGHAAVH